MFEGCGAGTSPLGDLSRDEFMAWATFLQAHAAVARGLDADLRAAHNLTLNELEILLWLAHDSCVRMRMAALADSVQLSPSGLSRAIERLETRGLVSRQRCEDDRRGAFAVLTDTGVDLVRRASVTHAAGIRRRFLERLTATEMQAFASFCERVLAANERICLWSGGPAPEAHDASCSLERDDL
jgi:DNA-binding MarR family transcriptional regulator